MKNIPKIICGPIIGTVTTSSVRILIEFEEDCEISIILKNEQKSYKLESRVLKNIPTIFLFENLEKHTLYNLSFEHPVDYLNESLSKIPVRFYTLGKLNSKFAIIYGNCIINEKNYEDKFSLLKHLSENINNYDYVFHCGNQVLIDQNSHKLTESIYYKIYKLLENVDPKNYEDYSDKVKSLIKQEYLNTYNNEYIAKIHRSVPNFLIFGENEILNNFNIPNNNDLRKIKFNEFFIENSRYYYFLYQKQLREDITYKIKPEFYHITINDVGLFFIDTIACRNWCKKDDNSFLGKLQWTALEKCFGNEGEFRKENIKTAILFTRQPLLLTTESYDTYFKFKDNTSEEKLKALHDEHLKLLELIKNFKLQSQKNIILIGNHNSMSGFTDVFYQDKFIFKQLITGSIVQEDYKFLRDEYIKSLNKTHYIYSEYSFEHDEIGFDNNYGILSILGDVKNHSIYCNLVKANPELKKLPQLSESINIGLNKDDIRRNCDCCLII